MLRRVRRALRISTFAAGVVLLLWLALSQTYLVDIYFSWGGGAVQLVSHRGTVQLFTWNQSQFTDAYFGFMRADLYRSSGGIGFEHNGDWPTHFIWNTWPSGVRVALPLWHLCVVLLAVPLLPFIPRKRLFVRKEPQGFPVELVSNAPPAPGPESTAAPDAGDGRSGR